MHKFRKGRVPRMSRPDIDPFRKVRFREAAREIVAKDRYDRKYGRAVDTAGAIARAMDRAYRQGFEDAQSERPVPSRKPADAGGSLDWVLIPPRPRSAFWTLCLFALGARRGTGTLWTSHSHDNRAGNPRMATGPVISDGRFNKTIGEKTILPLVRLGLLEIAGDGPERVLISDRGKATWRLFLQRGGQYPEDLTQV
jgi:hypothetical protein